MKLSVAYFAFASVWGSVLGQTAKPTTRKPTSKPTTRKPTTTGTSKPTTRKPTSKPTTRKPTQMPTNEPTTNEPTTNEPTTIAPTTNEPTTNEPTKNEPTTSAPTTDSPTTNSPTTYSPTTDSSTTNSGASIWACYNHDVGGYVDKVHIWWGFAEADGTWACNEWSAACNKRCTAVESGDGNNLAVWEKCSSTDQCRDGCCSNANSHDLVCTPNEYCGSAGGASSASQKWLQAHNKRREEWHTGYDKSYVPLQWSNDLEAQAKAWAEELLSRSGCSIEHGEIVCHLSIHPHPFSIRLQTLNSTML